MGPSTEDHAVMFVVSLWCSGGQAAPRCVICDARLSDSIPFWNSIDDTRASLFWFSTGRWKPTVSANLVADAADAHRARAPGNGPKRESERVGPREYMDREQGAVSSHQTCLFPPFSGSWTRCASNFSAAYPSCFPVRSWSILVPLFLIQSRIECSTIHANQKHKKR